MEKKQKKKPELGLFLALGLCFGSAIGLLLDNMAMGPGVGLLFGVVAYQLAMERYKKES
ncbi:MAG TPA: hypothetical protein GXX23_11330 [Firmicutes bacterium]|nr:hypothetical protein [Candidatus Fermentithermobacillaceae bacterium]